MDTKAIIEQNFRQSLAVKKELLDSPGIIEQIGVLAAELIACFKRGNKVLFCGNGGSAADAQHLAAEFSSRYAYDRAPLPSEALHVNTSYLTAAANDYSYEEVFARLIRATGEEGDLLVALSTSGNSANVVRAVMAAKERKVITIGLTGQGGGKLKGQCDFLLEVPSHETPRIQECHMLIGHTLCQIVEETIFPKDKP